MVRPSLLVLLLLMVGVAGCADDAPATPGATAQTASLRGLVVTEAIVPIEGAAVTVTPGELMATTDANGLFAFEGLEEGSYLLLVKADGYADARIEAATGDALVKAVLTNVRTDVPYIEQLAWDGYLMCTTDQNIGGYQIVGAPCLGIIDILTGQQVSQDVWQFPYEISAPGLKGSLAEMVWEEQALGKHMGMLVRNIVGAGGGIDAGGTNTDTQYASAESASPLLLWMYQGIENPGSDDGAAYQVPQNDTMAYKLLVLGRADDSQQADLHLMVENRPQVFLTNFYHAMGDPSYSIANGNA